MNLFENLQLMKESDTSIVSEFREFLSNKNAQYIANEIDETRDGMQLVIYDGDWKHEHLYMKHLLDEFFTDKGMNISITSEEIGESDQDTYSARYDIIFNVKSPKYSTDGSIWSDTDSTEQDLNDGLYEGKHYGGAFDIRESKWDYREPIKSLQNDKGDYINVYKDKETGRIRAEGDIIGGSFNGPWSDKDEEYYINKGFKEVT